jgi:hypothetical protein
MLRQTPWPEQSLGQRFLSHAAPVKPAKQLHSAVALSHVPRLEHSTSACAWSAAVGTSAQAREDGQLRCEQSAAR